MCNVGRRLASTHVHIHLSCLALLVACNGSAQSLPDAAPEPDAPAVDAAEVDAAAVDASAPDAFVPEAVVIASGEAHPESIAVFDGTVYWMTSTTRGPGQVRKASMGHAPQVIAANEESPLGLAVGNGALEPTVYWGTASLFGQVRQVAASGAPPIAGAPLNDLVLSLALDGDTVFAGTRGGVYSKPLGSGWSVTRLPGEYSNGVTALTADSTGVVLGARRYPDDAWIVATMWRSGGPVKTLHTGTEAIRGVAISGLTVFWIENNSVWSVPRSGGTPVAVKSFTGFNVPSSIVASGGTLYVAVNQGVINPSGATGSIVAIDTVTFDAREIARAQLEPSDVAVDASYVYWTNRGIAASEGAIMRIRR